MGNSIVIKSLNISKNKGTVKTPCNSVELTDSGIKGDAHSGPWHRQVSMLGVESIRKQEKVLNRKIEFGEFAENITSEGFLLNQSHPLDRFISGSTILEVTQIGKKCHGKKCGIFKETGNCVMPKEGIFCRVISGGELKVGDSMNHIPKTFKLKVITLSDRAYAGIYQDRSGKMIIEEAEKWFSLKQLDFKLDREILPDDKEALSEELLKIFEEDYDIVITTGSTGLGTRDIAPEIIKQHLDREIPGIMEFIRVKYGMVNPNAYLSRSVAGLRGKTIIYTLPGSTKAIKEYMEEILKSLWHIILMVQDIDSH
jgi:molybdenum cofactor synthesis domain-containing protein